MEFDQCVKTVEKVRDELLKLNAWPLFYQKDSGWVVLIRGVDDEGKRIKVRQLFKQPIEFDDITPLSIFEG